MKLDKIKPNQENPRKITPEKLENLKASIERDPEFMRLRPIVVDGDGVILGGNQRYQAILKLGMYEIPDEWVISADKLTEEQARRFVLVDNSPDSMSGEWDEALLAEYFDFDEIVVFDEAKIAKAQEKLKVDGEFEITEETLKQYEKYYFLIQADIDDALDIKEKLARIKQEHENIRVEEMAK